MLVENNGDQRLPPAERLTKLMTATIATLEIRRGQIGENDPVTVSENAWRTGGSRMFGKVGSQVTVSDLLHGIIIGPVTTPASPWPSTSPAAKTRSPT